MDVVLEAFDFTTRIRPALGGAVMALDWTHNGQRFPLLHPAGENQASDSTAGRHGLWPMVPFANRAFDGRLLVEENQMALPVNDPGDGSTMHGFGWQNAWDIVAKSQSDIKLRHTYNRHDPYAYEAWLSIALRRGEARFDLAVQNIGERPLPFGIGFHPWFPRSATTRLRMISKAALRFGPRYRAIGFGPLDAADDYRNERLVPPETGVSFIDWDGEAVLFDPATGLSLTIRASETMRHPVLWTPAGAPFVCFEPQSHAIGAPSEAIVRQATPMTMLAPGEQMSGWMTLEPFSA